MRRSFWCYISWNGQLQGRQTVELAHQFGERGAPLSGRLEAGSRCGAQRQQHPRSCSLSNRRTSPISFFGADGLQRSLWKHVPQHGHEITLGKCARTIAQHWNRAGGLGVSEESLDLLE